MKITFPHMGNVHIAAKALFEGLGIEYVSPPQNSKTTLEIGSIHSPEEMCLPFKIMIGNYIQSVEQGADTVLLTGSCGPCRFGEYCEMQMNLLKKIGHPLDFIVLDMPQDIGSDELFRRIKKIASHSPKNKLQRLKAVKAAVTVLNLIDEIEETAHFLAGYEIKKGQCKQLLHQCKSKVMQCTTPKEMIALLSDYKNQFKQLQINKHKNPIKISIIGEIYTVIEPFSNLYIEDKLMDYGISTKRKLTPSWWFKNMLLSVFNLQAMDLRMHSKEYLPLYIGGHGRECVGEAMMAYKEGFDGAIQIFPIGCMPEIVSKSILSAVSRDKDFPILTLVVDEMTGEAGYVTRIEAFIDLLERRREHVLSGS